MENEIRGEMVQSDNFFFRPFCQEDTTKRPKEFFHCQSKASSKSGFFINSGNCFVPNPSRRRRSRTNFSNWQLLRLESTFQNHHYPDIHLCQKLTNELSLSGSTIQVWFQNRRAKWRRQENTKRGPGRPSSSAPRTSCSGEPLSEEEIVLKIMRKNLRKKQTSGSDRTPNASPDARTTKTPNVEARTPPQKENFGEDHHLHHHYHHHHHGCSLTYLKGGPSEGATPTKMVTRTHLPFNIENLLST